VPARCPLPAVPAAFPHSPSCFPSATKQNKQTKPLFFSFEKQTRFCFLVPWLEKQHSPKRLTKPRIAFIDSFCTRRSDTDRNRRDGPQPQQRAHFFAHPPTRFSLGSGEDWSGGQAAWQQRGSAGLRMGHGARATPARSLPRSVY